MKQTRFYLWACGPSILYPGLLGGRPWAYIGLRRQREVRRRWFWFGPYFLPGLTGHTPLFAFTIVTTHIFHQQDFILTYWVTYTVTYTYMPTCHYKPEHNVAIRSDNSYKAWVVVLWSTHNARMWPLRSLDNAKRRSRPRYCASLLAKLRQRLPRSQAGSAGVLLDSLCRSCWSLSGFTI